MDNNQYQNPRRRERYQGHYAKRTPARRRTKKVNPLFIGAIALVVVLVTVLLIIFLKPPADQSHPLLGSWKYDQYTQYEFSEDGAGCLCVDDAHYTYSYTIAGNTLSLDFAEEAIRDCEYTFSVENSTLTLVGGEGTDQGTYTLNKVS